VLLRAQLDGHSEAARYRHRASSAVPRCRAPWAAAWGCPAALRLDLALSEDLITKSAPDVVFLVAWGGAGERLATAHR
jgi:hypothetical protein